MPRLLILDDSLEAARFMQMLAANGFLVEHVATLAEAIERTKKREFEALVLELNLPDMQGIASYLAAREQLPMMPIVILTNVEDDHTVAMAYVRGAQDFLFKSKITADWLAHSVHHAVFRAQQMESPEAASQDETAAKSDSVLSQKKVDEVIILSLIPKRLLEASVIMAIEQRLTSLVDGGHHNLVVNLENVDYISNAALGVLIGTQKKIQTRNGKLYLAHVKTNVRNQLGSRQFHRLFEIHDDVASAIASIDAAS